MSAVIHYCSTNIMSSALESKRRALMDVSARVLRMKNALPATSASLYITVLCIIHLLKKINYHSHHAVAVLDRSEKHTI